MGHGHLHHSWSPSATVQPPISSLNSQEAVSAVVDDAVEVSGSASGPRRQRRWRARPTCPCGRQRAEDLFESRGIGVQTLLRRSVGPAASGSDCMLVAFPISGQETISVPSDPLEVRPKSYASGTRWDGIGLDAPLPASLWLGHAKNRAKVGHHDAWSSTSFSKCPFSAGLLVSTSAIFD